MHAPVAETYHGLLRGVSVSPEVWGYFGIPYAAAPVGPLRWRPPEEPLAWSGVREAVAFGADPIQPVGMRTSRAPSMSEDCLYLNIWTPKDRREGGWPVLIWSCGGAFTMGSGAFVEEDPAKLAARGAVVVSFNVRLNIFGFLAHPALSAESPHGSSGNYGLLDQAAAFRWVRNNIQGFNGDNQRVTFFGQSAGSTMGMLLLSSPIVEQPYDRAIFQSPGSYSALLPLEEAERHGAPLGLSAEDLRHIPADRLVEKAAKLPAARSSLWLARPVRPIADGWVIRSQTPMSVGNFDAVPAIIGINEDEGRFFGPRMGVRTVGDFENFVRAVFGDNANKALQHYPVATDGDVPAMFSTVYGDRGFSYPIDQLARAFSRSGQAVYRYVYSYRQGDTDKPPTHSEEAAVLMDNLPHVRAEDAAMADMMARYWINFAETGNPNASGLAEWPTYDEGTHSYLRLDVPPSIGSRWRSDHVAFVAKEKADGP